MSQTVKLLVVATFEYRNDEYVGYNVTWTDQSGNIVQGDESLTSITVLKRVHIGEDGQVQASGVKVLKFGSTDEVDLQDASERAKLQTLFATLLAASPARLDAKQIREVVGMNLDTWSANDIMYNIDESQGKQTSVHVGLKYNLPFRKAPLGTTDIDTATEGVFLSTLRFPQRQTRAAIVKPMDDKVWACARLVLRNQNQVGEDNLNRIWSLSVPNKHASCAILETMRNSFAPMGAIVFARVSTHNSRSCTWTVVAVCERASVSPDTEPKVITLQGLHTIGNLTGGEEEQAEVQLVCGLGRPPAAVNVPQGTIAHRLCQSLYNTDTVAVSCSDSTDPTDNVDGWPVDEDDVIFDAEVEHDADILRLHVSLLK